jgi:MFS family permease
MSEAGAARSTRSVVAVLGTTQTIAWASSYYLPAVLADPIARDIGVSPGLVFAAFSLALLVSGVLGPLVGRMIDRRGGRDVLCVSNLVLAAGLLLLSMATGPVLLFAGWLLIGVGIAAGLYDAAFATLVGIYRERSRTAITGITLIAGFASTIGWPLTALIEDAHGWRMACICWALVHLFVCLPANRWLLPPPSTACGKRHVSNVPAQALALLNSELVHALASRWGERVAAEGGDDAARIKAMWVAAFARAPRAEELDASREFLVQERALAADGGAAGAGWGWSGVTGKMLSKNSRRGSERPKTRIESEHRPRQSRCRSNPNARRTRVKRSAGGTTPSGLVGLRNLSAPPSASRIRISSVQGRDRTTELGHAAKPRCSQTRPPTRSQLEAN